MSNEIEELAHFCSYMMKWIDRQAGSMTSVGIDREVILNLFKNLYRTFRN